MSASGSTPKTAYLHWAVLTPILENQMEKNMETGAVEDRILGISDMESPAYRFSKSWVCQPALKYFALIQIDHMGEGGKGVV